MAKRKGAGYERKVAKQLEKWLNFVCPKSLILYAEKPVRGTR